MNTAAETLLLYLRDDEQRVSDFIGKNSNILEDVKGRSLSVIALRYIFFHDDNKFTNSDLNSQTEKFNWIKTMLQSFYDTLIVQENDNASYESLSQLFSLHYINIKKDFNEFIDSLEQKKLKNDLFACLIAFFSFLNGNKKYLNILHNIGKNSLIKELRLLYETKRVKSLWKIISDYCKLKQIPILYSDNKCINPGIFDIELDELKCFCDLCSINEPYKKLIQTLFSCLKNEKDLRENRPEKVRNFISDIFSILNICFRKINSWNESYLNDVYSAIYNKSFEYSSKDFNETYIDFVIHYTTKFQLSPEDFFHLFLNGLVEGNFRTTFNKINFGEINININDNEEKIIQSLIQILIKKKKKNKLKKSKKIAVNSISINTGDKKEENSLPENSKKDKIIESNEMRNKLEKRDNINKETELNIENIISDNKGENIPKQHSDENIQAKNETLSNPPKNEGKSSEEEMRIILEKMENEIITLKKENNNMAFQINDLTNKIEDLTYKNEDLTYKNKELEDKYEELKEQFKEMEKTNSNLISDKSKKDIQIQKLNQNIKEINKKLEIFLLNFYFLKKYLMLFIIVSKYYIFDSNKLFI